MQQFITALCMHKISIWHLRFQYFYQAQRNVSSVETIKPATLHTLTSY